MRFVTQGRVVAALLLFCLFPAGLHAQDPARVNVMVTVLDVLSGEPIEGVLASVEDLGLEVATDSKGVLVLSDIPIGPHQLTLQHEGYETASGQLNIDKAGAMVIRMRPIGGPGQTEMSRVSGVVRDLDDREELEGVAVRFPRLDLTRVTDSDGRFSFENVPPGEHTVRVELLGYATREETVAVEGGKFVTVDLTLAVEPIELDPIEVSVEARNLDLELSGFYQRRDATSGLFITRERIEERAPLYTTDLFGGLAGVKIATGLGMGTQRAVVLTGSRQLSFTLASSASGKERPCYPAVWIDGQMVHQGTAGPLQMGPAFLDSLIDPENIAGIEVYNSPASVPVQYNLYAACGVVVIWTRHGG